MITNLLRWVVAVPAGLAAWAVATFSIGIVFGTVHGFELVDSFWAASDMNGMPIRGTYILFVTRCVAAAYLAGVMVFVVPHYHKQVAIVVAILVSSASIITLAFMLFQAVSGGLYIGLGGWYRGILEMLSVILGAILGAVVVYEEPKKRTQA